jgi:hypothetical protein
MTPHDSHCAAVYDGPGWHEDLERCARCRELDEEAQEERAAQARADARQRAWDDYEGRCDSEYDRMRDEEKER